MQNALSMAIPVEDFIVYPLLTIILRTFKNGLEKMALYPTNAPNACSTSTAMLAKATLHTSGLSTAEPITYLQLMLENVRVSPFCEKTLKGYQRLLG